MKGKRWERAGEEKSMDLGTVLRKRLSSKDVIIFIFQYIYDQAKVMAVGFTGLIQTVARQKTRSRPFATWKLSVEVGP